MTAPTRLTLELVAFAVVPLAALALGLSTFAGQDRLALDFHEEVYPQAEAVVHGDDPYPEPGTPITDTTNAVWPIAAVLPAVPLTALPPARGLVATAFVLAMSRRRALCIECSRLASLRRHAALAPRLFDALPDRERNSPARAARRPHVALPGPAPRGRVALGAIWRSSSSCGRSSSGWRRLAGGGPPRSRPRLRRPSLLALLPFISLTDYFRLLRDLGDTFDEFVLHPVRPARRPRGVVCDGPRGRRTRRVQVVLVLAWRRRSFGAGDRGGALA